MDLGLKYIVVGTGRSGTVYMSKLLTECGFPCGHETIFNENGINADVENWKISSLSEETTGNWLKDIKSIVADSSYMAVPHLNLFPQAKIIHVVRHPLKVIRSFVYGMNFFSQYEPTNVWESYIYSFLPELCSRMSQLERCALYYVLWNKMVSRCDLFFKIEDDLSIVLNFLNVPTKNINISNKTNTFTKESGVKTNLVLENIPNGEIKTMLLAYANSLGYELTFKVFS